ncbi:protein RepA [Xenorhabdus bovienii]|uniref:RepB family plasmid replication initiator protein n=1 Tax=Xenorhabdus bovienii TaxID=40576 RepID=UPI00237CB48B|nr:RepB family plasmid replication initiator protein [Xenorhabdus bovienii]MDE1486983.1 protein RepA [Xenorhabdus bovienii]MDE1495629.1 protein RepA [Xenorhabdus bovienii]MDE9472436.1 protein RepA [Xenorhabdus bovienii]MDE9477825.1 protein RepA [Xenorhabdus bovienii]MDE9530643.1 protein RepA [Xenorhabdus bovienii]
MNNSSENNKFLPSTEFLNAEMPILSCNTTTSVQPNVLLRTGVFTPIGRRNSTKYVEMDLSEDLRSLELCQKEGYDRVSVRGDKLNVETDFKVWCGIVLAFSTYGEKSNKITLKFSEFAKFCAYPSRRFDKNLRRQIGESLGRIQSQSLSFLRKGATKGVHTGLLLRAEYDEFEDIVALMADENLWDLYRLDYQVLVSLKVLDKLPRAEVAQCLYLYFVALPERPIPVSFERLRERLQLNTSVKEANRKIKIGIQKLESIGFLSGNFVRKDGETYYIVDTRNKKLIAVKPEQ